jgi:hypothetical protein
MAQLHGRVLGFPHRRRLGRTGPGVALAVLLLMAAPSAIEAQTVGALGRAAADLQSEDAAARERAFRWLSSLDGGALGAIQARLEVLARTPLDPEQAQEALYAFRHAVGSRRADDMVDIAPGVLPVLAERRDAVVVGMAERLALARALEGMDALAAGHALCDLMGREESPWPWRWEVRRVDARMGPRALPMLLVATGHDSRLIRRWARDALESRGPPSIGVALRRAEALGLPSMAALLHAWGEARVMDAMPTVVAFVDDPRQQVREAARTAVDAYGRNIIWQLRRAYELHTGDPADPSWSTDATKGALYALIDRARLGPAREALERGLAAHGADELDAMEAHFERALRDAPGEQAVEQPMAAGWAALADARLADGAWEGAARAYRRALWAAPAAEDVPGWRRRLALAEAEQALSDGLVDLPAYEVAMTDPALASAAQAVDRLSGAARERDHARRRYASGLGALLLAMAGFQLLRRRSAPVGAPDRDDEMPVEALLADQPSEP